MWQLFFNILNGILKRIVWKVCLLESSHVKSLFENISFNVLVKIACTLVNTWTFKN